MDDYVNDEILIDEQTVGVTDTGDRDERSSAFVTFDCTEPNCVMQFRREDRLRAHLLIGSHKIVAPSFRLLDKATLMYKEALANDNAKRIPALSTTTKILITSSVDKVNLQEGWALFRPRPNIKFTVAQKSYLNEKYDEGEKSGAKWDPNRLAEVSVILRCDFKAVYNFRFFSTCKSLKTRMNSFFNQMNFSQLRR